ncbi:unnamed protein product [Polarella glacialis]|nr:unnamed protein product [Polarella glacialis]
MLEPGVRRLLVCGSSEVQRQRAAAMARRPPAVGSSLAPVPAASAPSQGPPARQEEFSPAKKPQIVSGALGQKSDPWAVLQTMAWPANINMWGTLQKVIWAGHPKLKPGWIRVMSKSRKEEYYLRLRDKETTFSLADVLQE